MRNQQFGFPPGPTQTDRRRLEAWIFGFKKKRDCTIRVAKAKVLFSCAVTAQLIYTFVFAYADCRFSDVVAQFKLDN